MLEIALTTIILLNIALIFGRSENTYQPSLLATSCFVLGVPIGIASLLAAILLSGSMVLSLLVAVASITNILHLLSLMADGSGGG